jgi:SAM-dependent methyltransferase
MTGKNMSTDQHPPVCDYEGSDYQARFWETGSRDYEDRCEAIALARLLPHHGNFLLELGAGAGRNTPRYKGFEHIFLLDFSRTQLQQAQERLGTSSRYIYIAADIYRLPFIENLFDAATMIRTLHHMVDVPASLRQVYRVLQPGAAFILEYANKRNLKAILRYMLHRQSWNPFDPEPVEFAPLNFDFHPHTIHDSLRSAGFSLERKLAVSHFRLNLLKRHIPASVLAGCDSLLQWTGALWQLTPSIFIRARSQGGERVQQPSDPLSFFQCPDCRHSPLAGDHEQLTCPSCQRQWKIVNGIYDFRGEE